MEIHIIWIVNKIMVFNERYQNDFSNLINSIQKNECCLFIGAGLSSPAGYPSWSTLLERIRDEVLKVTNDGLEETNLNFYDKAGII